MHNVYNVLLSCLIFFYFVLDIDCSLYTKSLFDWVKNLVNMYLFFFCKLIPIL